uniref:Branched-chain amino acid transport system carrier protein n=1 Tax=Eubacterium cellulosolvens (strain ATCC 43171 / JCM 9499 / 6) TaxID=633697 RepID=I5AV91_EUBC6
MKTKLSFGELISVSSMLFGLFFGAGNLIFPVFLGQAAGRNFWPALAGFLITGVGLPLLAVTALGLSGSSGILDLSQKVNPRFGRIFTCALYLTIGPFFACPRCITVPFETGVRQILPAGVNNRLALFVFSLIFYLLILWFSLRPGEILTVIGKVLNPVFICILAVLIFAALTNFSGNIRAFDPDPLYESGAFTRGMLDGYNTMDTLAGFAFGIIIIDVIRNLGVKDRSAIAGNTVRAGVFSCTFMGIIYVLTALTGAASRSFSPMRSNGGLILAGLASRFFPKGGALLLAVIVFLACLKTIIGLITSCAEGFASLFPRSPGYRFWAVIFCTITFVIANFGLDTILAFSLPVLTLLYPAAITLTILALTGNLEQSPQADFDSSIPSLLRGAQRTKGARAESRKRSSYLRAAHPAEGCGIGIAEQFPIPQKNAGQLPLVVVMTSLICSLPDLILALPKVWKPMAAPYRLCLLLAKKIPLFSSGFGWVVPTLFIYLCGLLIRRMKKGYRKRTSNASSPFESR